MWVSPMSTVTARNEEHQDDESPLACADFDPRRPMNMPNQSRQNHQQSQMRRAPYDDFCSLHGAEDSLRNRPRMLIAEKVFRIEYVTRLDTVPIDLNTLYRAVCCVPIAFLTCRDAR